VAIKLKQRSTETFVDSLVTSIGALYLAMISFVALYAYVGINAYQHGQTQTKLIGLDQLLALRKLTAFSDVSMRTARAKDLPHFFSAALSEELDRIVAVDKAEDNPATSTPPPPSKFDDTPIANSKIALDVPMRMAVNGTCDVLITQLASGQTFDFITVLIVGESHTVKSENVRLANFHGCQPGPAGDFQVLILTLDDGQYSFAIPRNLEEIFLGNRNVRIFSNYPFEKPDRIVELMPEVLKPYVQLTGEFVFVHGKAVNYFILKFANEELGKRLTFDRLDDAIQLLYEQKERDASYFGINASSTQLIRIGPVIYFVLSFELWRRVRRLPSGKLISDKYWFAFETTDILGRTYAYLYAFAPILFGIMIYAVFAVSQGLSLVLFGRAVTLPGLLTLDFPFALSPGWTSTDNFAFAILVFVPIQFLILIIIVGKLASVVTANLRSRPS
jgi:hypothetical protein